MRSLVLAVVVLSSSLARAQPAPGDAQSAAQYTAAALVASRHDDFETAIDMYLKAYAVAPHPLLLWDLAQAHRRAAERWHGSDAVRAAQHRDLAREFFRRFLATAPGEDMEGKARVWLARLDQQWAEEHPREQAERRAEAARQREAQIQRELARLEAERRQAAERDRLEHARISAAVVRTAHDADRSQGRTLQIAGAAAVAAGAAALGVGIYYGLEARRLSRDLSGRDVYDTRELADGNSAERFMAIGYLASGALFAGGAIAWWIGHRMGSHALERARATVAPAGRGAVLAVGGAF
jgi:hypothetical protein